MTTISRNWGKHGEHKIQKKVVEVSISKVILHGINNNYDKQEPIYIGIFISSCKRYAIANYKICPKY